MNVVNFCVYKIKMKNVRIVLMLLFLTHITTSQLENAFYKSISEVLRNSDRFKMYPKRVDCIVKELKSEKSIIAVNRSLYRFAEAGKKDFKVTFVNECAVMNQLELQLSRANFSCTFIGFAAIIFICMILIIVLSCVACISKK